MKIAIEDTTTVNKASGDIVSFEATSVQPLQSLTVHVEPVQDLHGYDNPWPAGSGKNKVPKGADSTSSGITFAVQDNGEVVATGKATALAFWGVQFTIPAGTYILNGCPQGGGNSTYLVDIRNKVGGVGISGISGDTGNGSTFTLSEPLTAYLNIRIASGYTAPSGGLKFSPMVRLASESDATFAPYSNICPISGWTGANVTACGVNLLDPDGWRNGARINISNGTVEQTSPAFYAHDYIKVNPNTTYTCNWSYFSYGNYGMAFYDKNKTYLSGIKQGDAPSTGTQPFTFTTPANTRYIRLSASNAGFFDAMQVNVGSSASAYKPYNTNTVSISWDGTVYGGTLDVIHGSGDSDMVLLDSAALKSRIESFSAAVNRLSIYVYTNLAPDGRAATVNSADAVSNMFACDLSWNQMGSGAHPWKIGVYKDAAWNYTRIYIFFDTTITTRAEAEAWLDNNNVQLCYRIAAGTEYDVTPQTIKTLLGVNNIWADAGEIDVEWRGTWKDITGWIAWQGLDFSRNDIDASDAGRDINGKMQRGRIAIKEKMTVRTVQLDQNDIATVHALCEPSQFNVRVNPYPRTNGEKVMTMYTNNVKTDYVIHRENGNDLQELSFPLIEI